MDRATSAPVKSALRTLDVIELVVARADGAQAHEIAATLSMPESSASYLLRTLCERGYLVRAGRTYRPGPGLDRLRLPPSALTLADRVTPLVRAMCAELNETTSFMVQADWSAEALVTETSDHPLRYAIAIGERRPLHVLAAGKAILAALAEDQLIRYFAEAERAALTAQTLIDEAALRTELARVRASGLAEAHEESLAGISSLGCAVHIDGQLAGALSIAVPTVRFSPALRDRFGRLRSRLLGPLEG
ncbi:IclR family transcriptional regulator [Novosphingobium piscinae]|uniref:Helix-turn-helix domain-containing protein n=1 Tax=Novosphingobium piscinae TaxID=1507448 RepID=A0A7X1FVQ6_9SPHN|nr:IclR family transcriptional regulator C-terminal domain-containing protein [Novosphingobium piscinae]MBC2667764.1 helix-turn-helix domain-containing protein [Novosphingobium piscinae]